MDMNKIQHEYDMLMKGSGVGLNISTQKPAGHVTMITGAVPAYQPLVITVRKNRSSFVPMSIVMDADYE
jgi:hypothetical protein